MKNINLKISKLSCFKCTNNCILKVAVWFVGIFFFTATTSYSQESVKIFEINQLNSASSLKSTLPSYIKPEKILPLINNNISSVIIENGSIKFFGENALRADIDFRSVSSKIVRQPRFDNVEIATIRINRPSDLFSKINLANLGGFTKLKYVYIICSFQCSENQISNSLIFGEKDYLIIYTVENQS
ncbi:MAG: hypothetical protein CVU03_10215 [Bacteroidetes bacterium HGW-Bacteroidetes-2]|jgi:hypothetical protein|nr:MAG: hypothetical protein CVU03_10215 [Bacteroidetes bacterium HGW-Bacteroidetes-2]